MSTPFHPHNARPLIGIPIGDPAGIGPEIVLKSLQHNDVFQMCRPVVIGSADLMRREAADLGLESVINAVAEVRDAVADMKTIPVFDVPVDGMASIVKGQVSAEAGRASYVWVLKAIELAQAGAIDAIATAPLTKESLKKAGVPYIDHTEILAAHAKGKAVTLLATRRLRVSHVMRHQSLADSVAGLTKEKIVETIADTERGLREGCGIDPVRIMVAGLNPHNSDGGLMGDEEARVIAPAVAEARARGIHCWGPVPADSAFPKALLGEADVVIAMYHDQGHIAVKSSDWKGSHGITLGIDLLRTSADHGSALDIAGRGIAHEDSMLEAIRTAAELASRHRLIKSGGTQKRLCIVADAAIPFVTEAFKSLGEVELVPGRSITKETLRKAELLLVRTVTRVDESLLSGTPVRFVGTATSGSDHVDEAWLREHDIAFSHARGCNALAVAQYIAAALLHLAVNQGFSLRGRTLGVIGIGHVGSKVVEIGKALGMKVLENDPPLARATGDARFVSLETVLEQSDIITLHVPLEREGPDVTWHLFDAARIEAMKPGVLLINSSRGAVVDDVVLLKALRSDHLGAAVLDVWEGEPLLDARLLEAVTLGTFHIAGYSHQAKARATKMILDAACRHLGQSPAWEASEEIDALRGEPVEWIIREGESLEANLHRLVQSIHDIAAEDAVLRELLNIPPEERGKRFDALRVNYNYRNEFGNARIKVMGKGEAIHVAKGLGFRV